MNIGLTVRGERMAPCFPGTDLWVLPLDAEIAQKQIIHTMGWHPLAWGRELMQRDITVLLCAGMDQFLRGALQGYGIDVTTHVRGTPDEILTAWKNGDRTGPTMETPFIGRGTCGKGFGRRKGRRGRW